MKQVHIILLQSLILRLFPGGRAAKRQTERCDLFMLDQMIGLAPPLQALIATLFTWLITALGALPVLFMRNTRPRLLRCMFGFSAGVMLASAFFSLLAPAAEYARLIRIPEYLPLCAGFAAGCLLLPCADLVQRFADRRRPKSAASLVLAITLHNIPEGMAIGVAFGSAAAGDKAAFAAACMLALGIGIQNFPEGAAVALPLRACGCSRLKAFFIGQLSGLAEPIAGIAGAFAVSASKSILPFMLAFAGGAMIGAASGELLPRCGEAQEEPRAFLAFAAGFILMMLLDTALG